jgi:hypothetical protein
LKEAGPKPKHAAILLVDAEGNVGHVGVGRLDRPSDWHTVWQFRDRIDTPLARWLRTLPTPPQEVIAVGSVGLHFRTARGVVDLLSPWFPQASEGCKRAGRRRPTGRIERDGSLRCWPSRSAAAADLRITRWGVLKKVRNGGMVDLT